MTLEELVAARVEQMYHELDLSCVHTTLKILAEVFDVDVSQEVYNSSAGMLGGGGLYGAQCGLFQGVLMFIGILSARQGLDKEELSEISYASATASEKLLGSLICREIRPEGFAEDNPPNLCEARTVESILAATRFISEKFDLPVGCNNEK